MNGIDEYEWKKIILIIFLIINCLMIYDGNEIGFL